MKFLFHLDNRLLMVQKTIVFLEILPQTFLICILLTLARKTNYFMSWNDKLGGFLTFRSFTKVIFENQSNSRRGKSF